MSMRSMGSIWQATLSGMSFGFRKVSGTERLSAETDGHASRFRDAASTQETAGGRCQVERVGEVHRQPAGHHQHRVQPSFVVPVARVAADPELGGLRDAARLSRGHGRFGFEPRGAALDLDKGETPAAHGDEIDLAVRRAQRRPRMR